MKSETVVIGAGIIGISIALELQKRGHGVTVLDRKGVAAEASQGNAGAFAFTDIVPLATPGIIRKAAGWLLDPMGPLSVPPSYALKLMPWMVRFWRASLPDRYKAAVSAQAALMDYSRNAVERQVAHVAGEAMMRRGGQLQLYEGEREFCATQATLDLRREHGIEFEILKGAEALAEIQPGLDKRFTHGVYMPTWMNTIDPRIWTEHLAEKFRAGGGKIKVAEIHALKNRLDGVGLETVDGDTIEARQVVVAAGAWSHFLAKTIGDSFPLECERGYNTTLPAGAFDLRTHLTFGGHGFVVTKIGAGIRIGGAVELGGLKRPPNFKRADFLLKKAGNFLHGLNPQGGKQWMGFRPSLPDSLPVIGRSRRNENVLYAFGHGHLGLTQSAGTAELIGTIVSGEAPGLSLEAYSPYRF